MKDHRLLIELWKDLLGFWLLSTGSVCVALLVNQLRDHPLSLIYATKKQRIEKAVAQVVASTAALSTSDRQSGEDRPQVIGLQEFREVVERKKAVILDARPEIFHRRGHVPGALSLSREEFGRDYARHKSLLESNKEQIIAVYCSGSSCEDSDMVADALLKLAYHHLLVFKGGWDEWTGAKLPQERQQ